MRMTLLGVLALVALGTLLLYVAKQIHDDHEKETLSGYPTSDRNRPDGLPGILDSQ